MRSRIKSSPIFSWAMKLSGASLTPSRIFLERFLHVEVHAQRHPEKHAQL